MNTKMGIFNQILLCSLEKGENEIKGDGLLTSVRISIDVELHPP
jgi:hypothetical protein